MAEVKGRFVVLPLTRMAMITCDSYFRKWGWEPAKKNNVSEDWKPQDINGKIELGYTRERYGEQVYSGIFAEPIVHNGRKGYDLQFSDPLQTKSLQQKLEELGQ